MSSYLFLTDDSFLPSLRVTEAHSVKYLFFSSFRTKVFHCPYWQLATKLDLGSFISLPPLTSCSLSQVIT